MAPRFKEAPLGESMGGWANRLSSLLKQPVINKTSLSGKFDLSTISQADLRAATSLTSESAPGSIFSLLEERQGLKLESHKVPVQIFAIDSAEKPSEEGRNR